MQVKEKEIPSYNVAYMRYTGPFGTSGIPKTWQEMMQWAGKNNLLKPDTITIGISQDNPQTTPPEKCRYDVCVVTDQRVGAPDVHYAKTDGGLYLTTEYVGTADEFVGAWGKFTEWFFKNGYKAAEKACLEIYYPGSILDPKTMKFRCDICIPLKK